MELPRRLAGPAPRRILEGLEPPAHALVFAGHMVDRPDRAEPRFPPAMEGLVREALDEALDGILRELEGGVVALGSGARGGDLLFREGCARRGVPHLLCLPFGTARFRATSVEGAGEAWVRRFRRAVDAAGPDLLVMPDGYREAQAEGDPYARFNVWLLELGRAVAPAVHVLALWNGVGGDGPGGTAAMVERGRARGGRVFRVDTTPLLHRLRSGGGRPASPRQKSSK